MADSVLEGEGEVGASVGGDEGGDEGQFLTEAEEQIVDGVHPGDAEGQREE